MKKATLLLFVSIVLACKKDKNEETTFPVSLQSEKIEITSDTRAYTKSGEVKDAQKIARLIKDFSYFHAEDDLTGMGSNYLTFNSKDSVIFNNGLKFAVKKSENQFLFTSISSFFTPNSGTYYSRYHITKYESSTVVTTNGTLNKEVRVAYGNYRELKIPFFAYALSASPAGDQRSRYEVSGLLINEFNEDMLSKLGTYDTIAVKSYRLTVKVR